MPNIFLNGAILMAQLAIALFFLRFWRHTRDRLFAWFALAFFLFGIERLVLVLVPASSESRPYVYIIRLVTFALIVFAIIDKNRSNGSQPPARR